MDVQLSPLASSRNVGSSPFSSALRLLHTTIDGTVESFVNIFENVCERSFNRSQAFPESLDGKVAIVTGGNAGIGLATATQLARRGAHVVIACRDKARAEAAVQAIRRTPPLPGCCNLDHPTPGTAQLSTTCAQSGASFASVSASVSSPPPPPPPASLSPGLPLSVEAMHLDLGRLSSVRQFAEEWGRRGLPLHLLVCNAGVMGPPRRLETGDGLEMQFQVNFLSHWLLANELMAIERNRRVRAGEVNASAAAAAATAATREGGSSTAGNGCCRAKQGTDDAAARSWTMAMGRESAASTTRVVMVTSLTHRAGALQWEDKQSSRGYEPFLSYGLSKLANIITAKELQRRFDRSPQYGHDTAVAVHPGLVSTDLANGFFTARSTGWAAATPLQPLVEAAVGGMGRVVGPLLMRTPEQSASVMLHACLEDPRQVAGRYLALGRPAQPDQAAEDPELAAELWSYAEQLTGHQTHPSLA